MYIFLHIQKGSSCFLRLWKVTCLDKKMLQISACLLLLLWNCFMYKIYSLAVKSLRLSLSILSMSAVSVLHSPACLSFRVSCQAPVAPALHFKSPSSCFTLHWPWHLSWPKQETYSEGFYFFPDIRVAKHSSTALWKVLVVFEWVQPA